MTTRVDDEDRRQRQLRRFGTQNPICVTCGESDPVVLELHHIARQKHNDDLSIVCANCHRKLSTKQRNHVPPGSRETVEELGRCGHYLLGLADLLEMVVNTLRRLGADLLGKRGGGVRYDR
jgi:hypothetical protein